MITDTINRLGQSIAGRPRSRRFKKLARCHEPSSASESHSSTSPTSDSCVDSAGSVEHSHARGKKSSSKRNGRPHRSRTKHPLSDDEDSLEASANSDTKQSSKCSSKPHGHRTNRTLSGDEDSDEGSTARHKQSSSKAERFNFPAIEVKQKSTIKSHDEHSLVGNI